ncbi:Ig-like domain-containing protein [Vibrio ponticus]|uniref:Ig-like domain-containing protein n=1 Tax=Vibrio ponticus TaxID=265668 RepID=UPI00111529F1|nr:cadherin-like domain-containing protein [Vibrio ponticus]
MKVTHLTTTANLVGGQSIVIGINGELRLLNEGEVPLPGELIITNSPNSGINAGSVEIFQQAQDQVLDITQDVNDILTAIEQGEDPTALDPDIAPAAGGAQGSSIGLSGTVSRDGAETQPQTLFLTEASGTLNLSTTQSLGLLSVLSLPAAPLPTVPTLPPTAVDDPQPFALIRGNMTLTNSGSVGWDDVTLFAEFDGQAVKVVEDYLDRLGVHGTDIPGGPYKQVQYDRESQQSETLSIKFGKAATQGQVAITNLFADERRVSDDDKPNNEVGVWVAYLNGTVAGSGAFEAGVSDKQIVVLDTNGNAFDEVVFYASEYSSGGHSSIDNDSSDYFVAGIEVSSEGYYATNANQVLRIPITEILSNDSDPKGTALAVSRVEVDPSVGRAQIVGDYIEFTPSSGMVGAGEIAYQVVDGDGEVASANIAILVNATVEPARMASLELQADSVYEGEPLIYAVQLDKPTIAESRYHYSFELLNGTDNEDINLDQVSFTNGVTIDTTGVLLVPLGVDRFDIVLPTRLDTVADSGEIVALNIASPPGGDLQTAEGTILDRVEPLIDVSHELIQGDITLDATDARSWNSANIEVSFAGVPARLAMNSVTGRLGILNGAPEGGPRKQIQFDRESGESEKLAIQFDTPATSGSFLISKLFDAEGNGDANHEAGTWVAKLNGESVASGQFDGGVNPGGGRTLFTIDTQGLAFDQVIFSATEYSGGINGAVDNDSSDYYLEGLKVSATHQFAIQETLSGTQPSYLTIPASHLFSRIGGSSDAGYQIVSASLTHLPAGLVSIDANGNIVFEAEHGFIGETNVEFAVLQPDGVVRHGYLEISVVERVANSSVETIIAVQDVLGEGDEVHFKVNLDKVTLDQAVFDVVLKQNTSDGTGETDIVARLADARFSHGVTASAAGQIHVPESVGEFEVFLPSDISTGSDGVRAVSLSIAGKQSSVDIFDTLHTATLLNDILQGDDGADLFQWVDQPWETTNRFSVSKFEVGTDKLDLSDILEDNLSLDEALAAINLVKSADNESVNLEVATKSADTIAIDIESDPMTSFDALSGETLLKSVLFNLPD